MYDLLFTGIPPLGQSSTRRSSWAGHSTFRERWLTLASTAREIQICVGYASNDAIAELLDILPKIDYDFMFHLSLGMAKFDGLPRAQFEALTELQSFLESKKMGSVNVVNKWPFHGKVSLFTEPSGVKRAILGSSNLSGIVKNVLQYECDIEISDVISAGKLNDFVNEVREKATEPLSRSVRIVAPKSTALDEVFHVEELSPADKDAYRERARRSNVAYLMPLKVGPEQQKSNLNVFFGDGRTNASRTWDLPRSWYEIELIPGRDWYRNAPQFPEATVNFKVVTDDGYSFLVNSSYDKSWDGQKNFRSSEDLQILGRWIKGRLESSGVLRPGERVTEKTLTEYGRSQIKFVKLDGDVWFMDFGV